MHAQVVALRKPCIDVGALPRSFSTIQAHRPQRAQLWPTSAVAGPHGGVGPAPGLPHGQPKGKGKRRRPSTVLPAASTLLSVSQKQPVVEQAQEGLAVSSTSIVNLEGPPKMACASLELQEGPPDAVTRTPLPHVLILHTGGTLGMINPQDSSPSNAGSKGLRPAVMLANVLGVVPELLQLSNVDLQVVFNKDSSRVGPEEWVQIARILDANRDKYDAFMIIHGTDTMAYTASALSLMLPGFGRPVVMTGSQLPLAAPRTDARQNLLDAMQCATAGYLQEVAVCFGGRLMRGNRCRKVHTSSYQAFDSPGYPHLAQLGIDIAWNERALLRPDTPYTPCFSLQPGVLRVPVVPGVDPRQAYGDLAGRGVQGAVLELFGVGNLPDLPELGWMPWLESQTAAGLKLALVSQCDAGPLQPGLYEAGGALSALTTRGNIRGACHVGVMHIKRSGMTPECAVVKLMMALANPDVSVGDAVAGEL